MNTWVRSEHHLLLSPKAGQKQRSSCWADSILLLGSTSNYKWCRTDTILVGGWTNPFEKYARQIGIISPGRVENKTYLKPPPSILVSEDKFLAMMFSLHESKNNHLCANDHHTRDTKIRWFHTNLLSYRIISYSLLLWELFGFKGTPKLFGCPVTEVRIKG